MNLLFLLSQQVLSAGGDVDHMDLYPCHPPSPRGCHVMQPRHCSEFMNGLVTQPVQSESSLGFYLNVDLLALLGAQSQKVHDV